MRAASAGLSAFTAVILVMLLALVGAGLADLRACGADCVGKLAASTHETGRIAADRRTVNVQGDASRHHLHVLFVQAGRDAVITGGSAFVAGIDTILHFLVGHDGDPLGVDW